MRLEEREAKSIITESKLPDADYVINPYTGCIFGCRYCYASFMGRNVGETIEAWGEYVYVKSNAVELCRAELKKMKEDKKRGTVLLSSVTDPYQGAEAKYKLTRGILEVLRDTEYPGLISILTKSPLVTRDIDVLSALPHCEVGMTITTTDDKISKWMEERAPLASKRLEALATLSNSGIETYAFIGPLLPHFIETPELLDELLSQVSNSGVRSVYIEHINLKRYIRERMDVILEKEPESVQAVYIGARKDEHRQALDEVLAPMLKKYGLKLRLDEVLYHNKQNTPEPTSPDQGT
jgi:DNA repair photolyase